VVPLQPKDLANWLEEIVEFSPELSLFPELEVTPQVPWPTELADDHAKIEAAINTILSAWQGDAEHHCMLEPSGPYLRSLRFVLMGPQLAPLRLRGPLSFIDSDQRRPADGVAERL
jgi:hypothetical protein